MSASTATQLHAALRAAGLLDADGYLKSDPRGSNWRAVIAAAPGLAAALPGHTPTEADNLVADESNVAEVLNVAWAMHEILSDQMEEALAFIARAHRNATPDVRELRERARG